MAEIGVIGGSGFYDMPGLSQVEEAIIETPFGPTSDSIRIGTLEGNRVDSYQPAGVNMRVASTKASMRVGPVAK